MIEVVVFLVAFLVCLWGMEQRTVFVPYHVMEGTPSTVGLEYKAVTLVTRDRVRLAAWDIPVAEGGRGTVLFFHGNGGNMSHRIEKAAFLHEAGFRVFLIDYRGFGESRGWPTEKGLYEDASTAYRYLTQDQKIPASQLFVYGESLGSAVAIELARRVPVRALIVEGGFTSIPAVSRRFLPLIPTFLLRYRFDSAAKVCHLDVPMLVFHSRNDEVVPFGLGRALYDTSAAKVKRFVPLRGAHNEAFYINKDRIRQELDRFIAELP
jgi:fermentation-respiration switch protein FrsA (DUF1100 family)